MNRAMLLLLCIPLLTGCWDQTFLKEAHLVYAAGFDLADDDKVEATTVIRVIKAPAQGGGGGAQTANEIITATGNTLRETRRDMDTQLSGMFTGAKNRVNVLGEEIAKTNVYNLFDLLYRDPTAPLGAKVIVTEGKARDVLEKKKIDDTLIGEYLYKLILGAEKTAKVNNTNLQLLGTAMFDEGRDFVLPYITYNEENDRYQMSGVALFNERAYTGETLLQEDATLYLLLSGEDLDTARFTKRVNNKPESELNREDFITIRTLNATQAMKITGTSRETVKVQIDVKMEVTVEEYPKDHLKNDRERKEINRKLSAIMTQEAKTIIAKTQEANSDVFGVGRELIAYHPEVWKALDKKNYYRDIEIIPNVDVQIITTGVLS